MTVFAAVVGVSAALYGVVMAVAFAWQRSLIYPAPAHLREPRLEGAKLERIPGPDGTTVYALHAPAPPGAPTLVHFHGNAEDLAGQAWLVQAMHEAGLGAYAIEYPGYGLARDAPLSEESIYAAAEAALGHLEVDLGASRDSIVLEGQSLGTGVAAEMARRGHGMRLVLISPFTSMVDMAAIMAPFLPVRWLVRDRYETNLKAPALEVPSLVIHGTLDEVIPLGMGQRIAKLLPNSEFFPIEGGHHADLFAIDESSLLAKIAAFARGSRADTPR